ncbi:DNA cytosine methyltransferase [Sphaerimonospora mesophila]|uniref:DNA cytosine methyltransferase n=1 Tax=Sphaerimonospora mesophila TaxID=37483 RepID=UPI0009FA710B
MNFRITRPINIIDLFAGCGGFTQGFHDFRPAGCESSPFRTVGAVEWDIAAASTYAANFADEAGGTAHIFPGDIKDWAPDVGFADVDVILGGPPCQGFSGLGKEDPDDPRNKLWREYVRVVKAVHPKIFVIENVDRFLRSPEFALLRAATDLGGALSDYALETKILNAADYGVPQARKRVIALATHRDLIASHPKRRTLDHPKATHRKQEKIEDHDSLLRLDEVSKSWVPARTVFERTPKTTSTSELPNRECHPLGRRLPGAFRTTELHIGRNPTPLSLARYSAIPPGGNRHDLPRHLSTESWWNHHSGSGDVMGRMYWDEPSVTIRTEFYKPEKGRYLHPFEDRPITHLEAALLQGFPEDFLWCGSKVQIARQIGNAVPVGLARAIAGRLYEYLIDTGVCTGDQGNVHAPRI